MPSDQSPLGIYVHVPFCAARCGYCDFNTYIPSAPGQQSEFVDAALKELQQARRQLGGERRVQTVFFGGGTPTLIGAGGLNRLLDGINDAFGIQGGAEVTTEANPESVDPQALGELRAGGFTRISLGMQSAARHVLKTLDRVHTPGRAAQAAVEAREAGFAHVSLDLIYGTPGETDADWEHSLEAALQAEPDHISAYALTIENGTALAAAIRRGQLPQPDDDAQARRYLMADERLAAAGLGWYEVSNWARDPGARCHHNIGYWRSYDWWGVGPGAHSHLEGTRWWNVLRPHEYAGRVDAGRSPVAGSEVLTPAQKAIEHVMLGVRMREGIELSTLTDEGRDAAQAEAEAGRVVIDSGRLVLTQTGRLFADAVVRALTP